MAVLTANVDNSGYPITMPLGGQTSRVFGTARCDGPNDACYIPSTMKERDFVDFMRIASTSCWAGDASQALALSTLSKPMTINRLGGAQSNAVMFSVRAMNCPPNAATAPGAFGSNVLSVSGSLTSAISTTT
jgi:hypothetical protein